VSSNGSLADITLGDLAKGVRRYQPFILAVLAIVLVAVFLPGKTTKATNVGLGASATGVTPGSAATAGQGAGQTAGAVAGTTGGGGGSGAQGGGGTSGGLGNGSALGPASPPAATADQWCDPATGRLRIPTLYTAPCVPPFSGDNGGATYNGVTAKTITVAVPESNNQAQAAALRAAANNSDSPAQIQQTILDYVDIANHHFQMYGRQIKVVFFTSTYNSNDSSAAQNAECQADATTVAKQIHAFISWDAETEECGTVAYQNTLANSGVMCFCTTTVPASYYLNWAPYVWGNGLPDETQGYNIRAEMICDEIAPYPPQFAGEADLNAPAKPKRSFGLIWPGASQLVNTDVYRSGAQYFAQKLKECGVNLVENVSFPIVDTNGPADAQTLMTKFKQEGISDVILVSDPLDPIYLTSGATKQGYFPEWIDTGSALTDQTHYGRLYDQTQWRHAFGLSLLGDRVPKASSEEYRIYAWAHAGASPPANNSATVIYPFSWMFPTGVQLAGPKLTPSTFQCGQPPYTSSTHSGPLGSSQAVACVGKTYPGLFGYPISPTNYVNRVANPVVSWGTRLWPWDDYNFTDDATLIWWDATAQGPDENGSQGVGMWRYPYGGKRYLYGQLPKTNPPWFNAANTVTVFDSVPAPDASPNYPFKCYYAC
jgi:hypothetical protein